MSGGIDSAVVRGPRRRRPGRSPRARRRPCRRSTRASTRSTTRTTRPGVGHPLLGGADRADGRRLPRQRRADRGGGGEPAGPGARHPADGPVQPARAPAADHGQQERGGGRLLHALRRLGRRLRPDQGRAQDAGLGPGPLAQRVRPRARRDRADPAALHRQAAVGGAGPRAGRHRLAAVLRRARRDHRRLRRRRPRHGRAARARARRRHGRARAAAGRRRRVQAPAVGPRNEDQPQGVRT